MAKPQVFEQYVGMEGVQHVAQPEGTELSFEATAAAALGNVSVEAVREAVLADGMSEEDCIVLPPWERRELQIGDEVLVVEPVISPVHDAATAEHALERIAERLQHDDAVAVLLDDNPLSQTMEEAKPHWVLLTGFDESFRVDMSPHWSQTNGVHIMDPLADTNVVVDPYTFSQFIEHSYTTLGGIYAYALLGPQAFYDERARQAVDTLDGQGWGALSYLADQEHDAVTGSFELIERQQPWTYEEVEAILTAAADGDEEFLASCTIVMPAEETDDLCIDFDGYGGMAGFEKFVGALSVLGERPLSEEAAHDSLE